MLLKCRECGGNVSSNLEEQCPHCGEPRPFGCCTCGRGLPGPLREFKSDRPVIGLTDNGPVCNSDNCGLVSCHNCGTLLLASNASLKIIGWGDFSGKEARKSDIRPVSRYFCTVCAATHIEPLKMKGWP